MLKLYGLPSCDTVRKARTWLKEQGHEHDFHAFAKTPDLEDKAAAWLNDLGANLLVNPKSRNFKALSEAEQAELLAAKAGSAAKLAQTPQLLKRPILETPTATLAGFDAEKWQRVLEK